MALNENKYERAINEFLDLLERPVGKLTFELPKNGEADAAILVLYDLVDRNPLAAAP